MAGQNDLWAWLQSLQQNQGAAQPYGAGAAPSYGTLPGGTMPGGQVMGRTATTPGAPSMGYPAMGPAGAQPQPAANAQSRGFNPFDLLFPPANAAEAPAPSQTGDSVTAGDDGGFNNPLQAASQANPAQGVAPGIGAYPDSTNYPHTLTPPGSPSATPRPADSNAKGPLASPDAPAVKPMKRRAGAPNLGYYQPNNRFIGIDAPNASAQNSMRAGPQGTALNLAGLFGGRGQGSVNPNAPAANAQPVSAASSPNAYPGDAGWDVDANGNPVPNYGPSADPIGMSSDQLGSAVRKPNWWKNL